MATPIDLPQSPLPRTAALVLAEAALQRQNSLLGATGATPSPGAAPGPAPGGAPPAVPLASPPPLQDRLSLSPEARQRLAAEVTAQALPGAAPPAGTAPKPVVPTGAPPGVPLPNPLPNPVPSLAVGTAPPSLLPAAPGTALATPTPVPVPTSSAGAALPLPVATALATTPLASPVATSAPALPATGVRPVVQQLVQSLLQQLAPPQLPLQAVRIQPWTPALVQWLEAASAPAPSASTASAQGAAPLPLDEGLPPLQTWLVHQGVVQTPDGPRGFALTLRLPLAWVEAQPPATSATPAPTAATPMAVATAGTPVAAPLVFADRAQALPSIPLALVLQNAASEGPAARTSALLVLEFQPLAQASVYGRELATPRLDPWVQMALLQASGQLAVEEEQARRRAEALCDTPGCPYLGRATCVQPFCSAMRAVIPVVPVLDRGETGAASSRPAPPLPASSPQSGKTKD